MPELKSPTGRNLLEVLHVIYQQFFTVQKVGNCKIMKKLQAKYFEDFLMKREEPLTVCQTYRKL